MEQMFDDAKVNVSKNGTFAEEFAINIKDIVADLESQIGKCFVDPPPTPQLPTPCQLLLLL